MDKTIKIPELLCPAGSFESFTAAVNNGADAVYFGGKDFNARGGALNFSDEEILKAIDYAHGYGAKVNITINTLYKDSELDRVLNFANDLYCKGADAFIVQDIGIFSMLRKAMPNIKIHASTQMTIHSVGGVKILERMGFDRVVLARELSTEEIKYISENTTAELEVFAHGALCVCYSGQCLMSSHIGGRSGNRGACAQPCRQRYSLEKDGKKLSDGYLLSPKDIMTLDILKDISGSGVSCLKIEGRMKNAEYVAIVTKAYREALDRIAKGDFSTDEEAIRDVSQIFNRGGKFSKGYFFNYSGSDMMSNITPKSKGSFLGEVIRYIPDKADKGKAVIRVEFNTKPGDGVEIETGEKENLGGYVNAKASPGDIVEVFTNGNIKRGDKVYKSFDKELSDKAKRTLKSPIRKLEIDAEVKIICGEPMELELSCGEIKVKAKGEAPSTAQTSPMDKQSILDRLSKTGGTSYSFNFINAEIGENIYIPVSELNELRRNALNLFEKEFLLSFRRSPAIFPKKSDDYQINGSRKLSVFVSDSQSLEACVNAGAERVYFSTFNAKLIKKAVETFGKKAEIFAALPKISRNYDLSAVKGLISSLEDSQLKGYLISTYGQLAMVKSLSKKAIAADYSFNVMNRESYAILKRLKAETVTLSTEMNFSQINEFSGGEAIVYGNIPLMITHQCPIGLYAGEKKDGKFCKLKGNKDKYNLTDKTNAVFPISTDCNLCLATILNGPKLNMSEKLKDFEQTNVEFLRLMFFAESPAEAGEITKAFKGAMEGLPGFEQESVTYGHYFRGVK